MPESPLTSPARLQALQLSQLLDSPPEESFDRISRMAQRLLNAPVALVSLVDHERQFFKSALGLSGPAAVARQTPLSHSFCQHVVVTNAPLVINDAAAHPLVCDNLAIRDLGIRSYLGFPIHTPEGVPLGSFCAIDTSPRTWTEAEIANIRDLTEIVNTQVALRFATLQRQENESRLTKISSRVPGVIYQFRLRPDGTSCFPYASAGIQQIYGVTPEEVRTDSAKVFSILHPDDYDGIVRTIQASAQSLQPWQHEYRVRLPGSAEKWLRGDATPEREPDGGVLWHGFITDVTERMRTEEALRESEARFRQGFEYAAVGKALLSPAGRWRHINKALLDMLGYREEELQGKSFEDITHPDDLGIGRELMPKLLAGEIPVARAIKRYRRADGRYIWSQLTTVVIRDKPGVPVEIYSQIEDITAARESAEAKRQMDQNLAESAKLESLGVLAGGVAHDFNNILTGVLGSASLLRLEIPANSPLLPDIERIELSARRAADLCRQLLAYSGKGRFEIRKIDLNTVVSATTRLLEISISKHTFLRYHLAPSLPAIEADETQIHQIIMNLVINASEAIGERSGVVSLATGLTRVDAAYAASLRLETNLPEGDYVWLEISDNGSGMKPEVLQRIFEPFFSTKFTGRGLGLAAVQGIVRGHKGGIKVYSEPGKGTTFRLLFPSAASPADSPHHKAIATPGWKGSGRVLIVDDEETVRAVATRLLEFAGFEVETAPDGAAGLERFRHDPASYAFVLLDLTMPHLDGEEAFRQMRLVHPAVRVVLMSGFNHQEIITRFAGKGLAGFVPKPLEGQLLLDAARQATLGR